MAKGNIEAFSYKRLTSAAAAQVFAGDCYLGGINLNSGTSVTVTIYDSANANTNDPQVTGTYTLAAGWNRLPFAMSKGLYIVVAGTSPDITVAFLS